MVDGAARCDRQARRGDVDAQHHGARAQALQRQRIVDFRGVGVVDRVGLHIGQRQVLRRRRCVQRWKRCAFGEVIEQKALPVELVARINRAGFLQQRQRRGVCGAAGFDHGFVFGRVFVRLEQNFVELFADRVRAAALA